MKNSILWGVLPMMAAALLSSACSKQKSDSMVESPVQEVEVQTIPYTVSVGNGNTEETRATVESDNKTLYFATGDKLYVTGTNIQGILTIQSGVGTASGTFTGNLTYSGSGTPASDLALTATLVSAQQTVGTEVTVSDAGAVTVNYPTTSFCSSVNEAVQKYSNLTGSSTYGAPQFSLSQQTAFLSFVITFNDGTTTGTELSAVVSNNSSQVASANVTTTTEDEKVVANFVLPIAKGTTLSSAKVQMGSKKALSITDATLAGQVYNVKKTQYTMAAAATTADKGKLICTDGHIHANGEDAACTKARVAKIFYLGYYTYHDTYKHGLALALTDDDKNDSVGGNWAYANNKCSNKNETTSVTDATWLLGSMYQWNRMMDGAGSATALRDGFSDITGASNLKSDNYWSSSEGAESGAWSYNFNTNSWYRDTKNREYDIHVRACLVF